MEPSTVPQGSRHRQTRRTDDEIAVDEDKAEIKALDSRRQELEAQLKMADEPPPLLHPSIADLYRTKVEEPAGALQREDGRLEASDMLRGVIDSILLTPGSRLRATATGARATAPKGRGSGSS